MTSKVMARRPARAAESGTPTTRDPPLTTMPSTASPSSFWTLWLLAASAGVALFGLLLVLAPGVARQGFSLLVYASADRLDTFGAEQVRYLSLVHAVLGSVMVGWGVALFIVTKHLFSQEGRLGWNLVAGSVSAWFLPDTTYSLLSGYWQNAVLNTFFLALYAIPLWATRRAI